MPDPIVVLVQVEMNSLSREPSEHVEAEEDQHHPDGELEPRGELLWKHAVEEQHHGAEEKKSQRMSQAPENALFHALPRARAPRGEARDRGDVIGVEGMPHADEETQDQKTDH
jgi:hypothetical protein